MLDLDLARLPDRLDVEARHAGAAVLLRVAGRVAGQAIVPLPLDHPPGQLRDVLLSHADAPAWEEWLRHLLEIPAERHESRFRPSGTIAVCTRDRPEDLAVCLGGLSALIRPARVLVVDNAPATSATRDLVARFPDVDYVLEPRPGLDNARNAAFRHTDTDVIAFIDDDARPDPHWFETLLDGFADPTVMAVTGLTLAGELESDAQIAFQAIGGLSRGFRRQVFDAGNCDPFFAWQAGAGVNMALRREALLCVGPFDPALDAGTRSLAGGDFDMFRRILKRGYRIVYDPQALNWHRHRRTMDELRHQVFSYEAGAFAIVTKVLLRERDPAALTFAARWLRRQGGALLRSARRRNSAVPFDFARVQALGASSGPLRYLRAWRQSSHA